MLNRCCRQTVNGLYFLSRVRQGQSVEDKTYTLWQCEGSSQAHKILATNPEQKDAGPQTYHSVAKRSGQRYCQTTAAVKANSDRQAPPSAGEAHGQLKALGASPRTTKEKTKLGNAYLHSEVRGLQLHCQMSTLGPLTIGMNRIGNFLWVKVLKLNRFETENPSALFKQGCI